MSITNRPVYQRRDKPKRNRAHCAKLVELGCIVCLRSGFGYCKPEIHHARDGRGQKKPDEQAIPLCDLHHRIADGTGNYQNQVGYHHSPAEFDQRYGVHAVLLADTLRRIA